MDHRSFVCVSYILICLSHRYTSFEWPTQQADRVFAGNACQL